MLLCGEIMTKIKSYRGIIVVEMDENDIETTIDDLMSILKQGDSNVEFGSNNFTILVKTTKEKK